MCHHPLHFEQPLITAATFMLRLKPPPDQTTFLWPQTKVSKTKGSSNPRAGQGASGCSRLVWNYGTCCLWDSHHNVMNWCDATLLGWDFVHISTKDTLHR